MKEKKNKKKKKIYKSTIVFIVLDIIVAVCFFITYGPYDKLRNLYVTTAMKTMNHQYFAKIFYSDATIEKIMASNYFVEINEDSNLDELVIDTSERDHYDNEYQEELLTRNPGNDLYKVINLKVGSSDGYLVAIYEPQKVRLISSKQFNAGTYGERILTMCERYGGVVCINGGGFVDNGMGSDIPIGYVIKDGEIVWPADGNSDARGNLVGMTADGKLKLMSNATGQEALDTGVVDAMEFGPFLIVNGKSLEITGDPWGRAPRVAIGQTKEGVLLFLVVDGENYINGASLRDMVEIFERYGAINAANLDGGQSSSLVINNKLYNNPPAAAKAQGGRYVVTGWGLIP